MLDRIWPVRSTKLYMQLKEVSLARKMRNGKNPAALAMEIGENEDELDSIASQFSTIPDGVLIALERLLKERRKLRALISQLGM